MNSSLAASAPFNVVGCILHDELDNAGFNSPPTPADVEFFRRYLRETYKDLKALNASWDAHYSDWDEIDGSPAKIRFATLGDRPAAPWADWHAASEQAAHRFYASLDERVRAANPQARLGPSGTRDSNGVNGFDWWLMARDFHVVCLYSGLHDELYRSFAAAGPHDDELVAPRRRAGQSRRDASPPLAGCFRAVRRHARLRRALFERLFPRLSAQAGVAGLRRGAGAGPRRIRAACPRRTPQRRRGGRLLFARLLSGTHRGYERRPLLHRRHRAERLAGVYFGGPGRSADRRAFCLLRTSGPRRS